MARYRKVEVKTWNDLKFRSLSRIPPCAQGLWLWFLTGTRTTNIPGIVVGTDEVMAAELKWPLEGFREAFGEALGEGMAKADWKAGVVWLPNASRPGDDRNKPESPNVIRSWRDTWDEIPECTLKLEIWQQLKAFAEAFGEGFGRAFAEACRKPSLKAHPNQEQEQKQKQEQNQERAREPDLLAAIGREGKPAGSVLPVLSETDRMARMQRMRALYPPGTYRESSWQNAERAIGRNEESGDSFETQFAGVERYRRQCEAKGSIGSQYVTAPEKFFADHHYREAFPLPAQPTTNGISRRKTFEDYQRESDERLATLPGEDPGPM